MPREIKIILQEDVENLGQVGDIVGVRPGYARNFLLPQKKAMVASLSSVRQLEHQKRLTEKKKAQLREASLEVAKKMADVTVTLHARVGEQGKLFGSITARDVAAELAKQGHQVTSKSVQMATPIKTEGTHKVDVRLQAGVMAQVKVWVVAENPPAPAAEESEEEGEAPAAEGAEPAQA